MDKRVVFAVVGSGKTTLLTDSLRADSRALLLTHTRNNESHLRARVIQRIGFIPSVIRVMTWFEFLHDFCCRPLLQHQMQIRGLSFAVPVLRVPRSHRLHFQDAAGRVYHRRLSLLLMHRKMMADIRARLERYFDVLLIDEVQDFAGHDFKFLLELSRAGISVLLVGDYYQHTFDTSRDGNINATLHENITRYESRFTEAGILPDRNTLRKTWRCSQTVCEFITSELHIPVEAHVSCQSQIKTVNNHEQAAELFADDRIIKLFYLELHRYGCFSMNGGAIKGLDDFNDVYIVLGSTHWPFLTRNCLSGLPPSTRNKLYVACSRVRGNIWFVPGTLSLLFFFRRALAATAAGRFLQPALLECA
ncbi:DNA helicase UvrD [Pantoea stewartii]|uniref:DNA helicase UvrD n=1 Tax=Pantoea stewartii TaxID=66269 RepID=UPI0025A1DC28|nr:DNA helicase UvrD [Pantoea stewartii]